MLSQLSSFRDRILRRRNHGNFIWCLIGLYGCRWRRERSTFQTRTNQRGECCCNKCEGITFALLLLSLCLSLVFLYFWGHAKNDYNDFDWFNFGNLGFWFPWSLVLLVIAAACFTYISVLMLLAVCLLSEGQRLHLHWSHKVGMVVCLCFSIGATAVLSDLWSKEWTTLLLSFQITAPYLHLGGVLLMTSLSWPIALHVFRLNARVTQTLVLLCYLSLLCSLYLVPLGMFSPCLKEGGTLGPKPALIGHRGAPMLAPENTQMSFEKSIESGSDGLETDVTISLDGVPFLMHDRTLKRTTNIQEVYPNRTEEPAAMFVWAELERLNAGHWFFSHNPFGSSGSLSETDRQRAENQSVCSLQSLLQLAANTHHPQLVIFDLYRPPRGHPYRDTWIQATLDVIQNQSDIQSSQVLWLPNELRSMVVDIDPLLQQTSGSLLPLEELQGNNIVKLNLHYSAMDAQLVSEYAALNISTNLYVVSESWLFSLACEYTALNISTNLYVISESWLFSLAWCSDVHSVTTNNPRLLRDMTTPLFLMTPAQYNLMWILTDLLSLLLIVCIFTFHWWRERGLAFSEITPDNGTYSKFKTEMSDIWSVTSANSQPEKTQSLATVTTH